jgi:hypothetical protein
MVFLLLTNNFCFDRFSSSHIPHQGGLKMNKILEKIKNFFSGKSEKKEEPKPQQEEPKAQEKPKEQK